MRKFSKVLALFICLATLFSLTAVASAADPTPYTFIMTNTSDAHTYEAYNIFTGDVTVVGAEHVLSSFEWGVDVDDTDDAAGLAFGAYASDGTIATAEDVANALKNKTLTTDALIEILLEEGLLNSVPRTYKVPQYANQVTMAFAEPGYYLFRDVPESLEGAQNEAYTEYMLRVVNTKGVTFNAKASTPTLEKKVLENNRTGVSFESSLPDVFKTGYNDVAGYAIGQTITFELIGTLPSNYGEYAKYYYSFHDTMSAGLDFSGSYRVYAVHTDGEKEEITTKFAFEGDTTVDGKYEFSLTCADLKAVATTQAIDQGTTIVLQYTATLNKNAEVGLPGNENTASLVFSNDPNFTGDGDDIPTSETPKDTVVVFTYELDLNKQNAQTPHTKLGGAEFVLYRVDNGVTSFYAKDTDGKWILVDKEENAFRFVSSSEDDTVGNFSIVGLDSGVHYFLREVVAPVGYNLLTQDLEFTVSTNITGSVNDYVQGDAANVLKTITLYSAKDHLLIPDKDGEDKPNGNGKPVDGSVSAVVYNTSASQLPVTGGMGTTLFYVFGSAMVIFAAVLLITKKRVALEQ